MSRAPLLIFATRTPVPDDSLLAAGFDAVSAPSSDAGSSCSRSSPDFRFRSFYFRSTVRFPHIKPWLLRFIQNFVKESRNIGDRSHGVLIVHAGGTDHRQ